MKSLVNHATGRDVTAGYVQMTVERLREPVQRVAEKIQMLCEITPVASKNVTKIKLKNSFEKPKRGAMF